MAIDYKGKLIDKTADFAQISQYAIEKYYQIPFFDKPDKKPKEVNRVFHGGVHVASTAHNIEILVDLYKKYDDKFLVDLNGKPLDEEDIKLLKLAAIYHDAANTSESKGESEAHAFIFKQDMKALGFAEDKINIVADAIINKDGAKGRKDAEEKKNIYQKLLQSADCLDVIRVVKKMFNKERLDIFKDLKDYAGFTNELNEIINFHAIFYENFPSEKGTTSQIHKMCEFSPNCFLTVKTFYEQLKNNKNIKPIDIVQKIVNEQIVKYADILQMYKKGIYVRVIDNILDEAAIIEKNDKALEASKLQNNKEIREYLLEQEREYTKVYAPGEFKWRPVTFLKEGLPVPIYGAKAGKQRAFIIISPEDPETLAHFFYKKVVVSNAAKSGDFMYGRTVIGRAKDKQALLKLNNKLEEENRRREGLEEDPGLHYYGKSTLDCNEVLLAAYQNVLGIGLPGFEKECALEAIKLYDQIKNPEIKFYRYSPENGIQVITREDVLKQANGTLTIDVPMQENIEKDKITNVQKISLNKPLSTQNPLKFSFNYKDNHCIAYVKNKIPIIEFHQKNGDVITTETDLLPFIAESYYRHQLLEVKQNISIPEMNINLQKKNYKFLVEIKISTAFNDLDQYDHADLLAALAKIPGLPHFSFGKQTANEITLLTPNLDATIASLKDNGIFQSFKKIIDFYLKDKTLFKAKPVMPRKQTGSKYPLPVRINVPPKMTSTSSTISSEPLLFQEPKTLIKPVDVNSTFFGASRPGGELSDSTSTQAEAEMKSSMQTSLSNSFAYYQNKITTFMDVLLKQNIDIHLLKKEDKLLIEINILTDYNNLDQFDHSNLLTALSWKLRGLPSFSFGIQTPHAITLVSSDLDAVINFINEPKTFELFHNMIKQYLKDKQFQPKKMAIDMDAVNRVRVGMDLPIQAPSSQSIKSGQRNKRIGLHDDYRFSKQPSGGHFFVAKDKTEMDPLVGAPVPDPSDILKVAYETLPKNYFLTTFDDFGKDCIIYIANKNLHETTPQIEKFLVINNDVTLTIQTILKNKKLDNLQYLSGLDLQSSDSQQELGNKKIG